jgi:hypothetical protein
MKRLLAVIALSSMSLCCGTFTPTQRADDFLKEHRSLEVLREMCKALREKGVSTAADCTTSGWPDKAQCQAWMGACTKLPQVEKATLERDIRELSDHSQRLP